MLGAHEVETFFEFFKLLDGIKIDGAHGIESALEIHDDAFDKFPIGLTLAVAGDDRYLRRNSTLARSFIVNNNIRFVFAVLCIIGDATSAIFLLGFLGDDALQ